MSLGLNLESKRLSYGYDLLVRLIVFFFANRFRQSGQNLLTDFELVLSTHGVSVDQVQLCRSNYLAITFVTIAALATLSTKLQTHFVLLNILDGAKMRGENVCFDQDFEKWVLNNIKFVPYKIASEKDWTYCQSFKMEGFAVIFNHSNISKSQIGCWKKRL